MTASPPPSPVPAMAADPVPDTAQAVLDFWLGEGLQRDWPSEPRDTLWFGSDSGQDQLIAAKFGVLVDRALSGGLADWEAGLHSRLALVIVLDQFTRNVHRGTRQAFAGDARAQQLVQHSLAQGHDALLPRAGRVFLYMPLMHAEDLALQDTCVQRFTQLHAGAPYSLRDTLASNLRFAHLHRDIVATYGRFPYRNAVLGRKNTPEEDAFLVNGPRFGQ